MQTCKQYRSPPQKFFCEQHVPRSVRPFWCDPEFICNHTKSFYWKPFFFLWGLPSWTAMCYACTVVLRTMFVNGNWRSNVNLSSNLPLHSLLLCFRHRGSHWLSYSFIGYLYGINVFNMYGINVFNIFTVAGSIQWGISQHDAIVS